MINEQEEKFLLLDYLLNHDTTIRTYEKGVPSQIPLTFWYSSNKATDRYFQSMPLIVVGIP